MSTADLLIEIGTEELPPKALLRLSTAFADEVRKGFEGAGVAFGAITDYAAPRRLALLVEGLPLAQADRETVRRGPALSAAYDEDGCATKAAVGFAGSCGVGVEALERLETDKGSWLVHRHIEPGRSTRDLVPDVVRKALAGLPIPKRMRWGDRDDEFVRPVHWVVLLLGDDAIKARILGVDSDRYTRGHRFHHPDRLYLASPDAYLPLLETEGHVLADHRARRDAIRAQVIEQANALKGKAVIDGDLLDEVTALVEWPAALSGRFDDAFLDVPSEALISSMQDHQKYFPVRDARGDLLPHFITVANIDSKDIAQVRAGNERVIRPRLSDAKFFWDQDRMQPLERRAEGLRAMVFQKKLGSLYDKQARVARRAAAIAGELNGNPIWADRAAQLSKCDLLTRMVFEFPELQGIMGRYYAGHDGEPGEVPAAIEEHYRPAFAGDALPTTTTGRAVALADRLDTLVGIFAIGQQPSGDKDPFGLRRAALGVLRILIEGGLDLDLFRQIEQTAATFDSKIQAAKVVAQVFDYMMERLRAYYADQGTAVDLFEAVLARRPVRPLDFHRRLEACRAFKALPEAESLAAANKRIRNILRKADDDIPERYRPEALRETAEKTLAERIEALSAQVLPLLDAGEYESALEQLAALRAPVDAFFDDIMVMVDEAPLRVNRLALLQSLNALFLRVADFSHWQS